LEDALQAVVVEGRLLGLTARQAEAFFAKVCREKDEAEQLGAEKRFKAFFESLPRALTENPPECRRQVMKKAAEFGLVKRRVEVNRASALGRGVGLGLGPKGGPR
jgi:hypothetical protein